jgi:hypothetical protein
MFSKRGAHAMIDYGPGPWLQECLEGAEDTLGWTRQHFPAHEDEVLAEIEFWKAALLYVTSGSAASADRTAVHAVTLESVRKSADHTLARYRESLESQTAPESFKVALPPGMAQWERLRDFVDAY